MSTAPAHSFDPTFGAPRDEPRARATKREEAPVLELRAVSKSFGVDAGRTHVALSAIDLTVREGEFVCIVGPSGCGKSTVLNLMAGLESPSSGEVRLRGRAVKGPGPDRTVMFQESALFPWLTVSQNVAFPLEVGGLSRDERSGRVERYLRMVHLWRFRDARPHELSGGMRQRAALARALVAEPTILLMDEPFAALDAQTRDAMHTELERIWLETQRTVVFVTHNVREAVRLGDRVVIMGTLPGRLERVIDVDLPRPRDAESAAVSMVCSRIASELKSEIDKVMREEVDDASERAQSSVRPSAARSVGGGF